MKLQFPESLKTSTFLQEYWQKKPLLMRGGLQDYRCPLEPEDLAGLACEEEIESRIVLERGGSMPWELRHGPFDEEDFAGLPESRWTLLVQDVDKHVPEVAKLLDAFDFLPD
ncbi:MAG: cupin domain-containing protein, partial [Gammaproteobacteria bacterium]|nr:cupin domain-containing protein [Gammaproteobacteria bacterium]